MTQAVSNDGQFDCLVGLVIDQYNQLVVCDVDIGRMQFFTLRGKFLSKLWDEYFNSGSPRYVAINNNDNYLLVADLANGHIFH